MTDRPDCYGAMFPHLDRIEFNRPLKGKAFTVAVESAGVGVRARRVEVDREAWEDCLRCPSYDACYHLCTARLLLGSALRERV